MKTYSTKSNAKRAAKAEGLNIDNLDFFPMPDNKWGYAGKLESNSFQKDDLDLPNRVEVDFDENGDPMTSLDKEIKAEVGRSTCPFCKEKLTNGYQSHYNLINEGLPGCARFAYVCLACNTEFGPAIKTDRISAKKENKSNTPKPLINKSTVERPTKMVWDIAEEMTSANPQVKRKEVIEECQRRGIAFYTARTQFQQWKTAVRNSIREEN